MPFEGVLLMLFLLEQIRTFCLMFVFGFFTGLVFKIYQFILYKYKIKKVIIHLSDLIFSIVTGMIGFLLLIYINGAYLRFYVIIAIISGFALSLLLFKLLKRESKG